MAREDAGRALEALGRAAADSVGATADEVPPVPEDLRSRWAEAYGRPAPEMVPVRPPRDDRQERSFLEWAGSFFTPRRMAWAGGAGAAMAAVLMMLSQEPGISNVPGGAGLSSDLTRGVARVDPGEPALVAIIAPAAAEKEKTFVLAALKDAYPVRRVIVLASANDAAALAQAEPRLVVVNLGSGLVTAWSAGQLADEFPRAATGTPAGVIDQIESADERLDQAAPAAP